MQTKTCAGWAWLAAHAQRKRMLSASSVFRTPCLSRASLRCSHEKGRTELQRSGRVANASERRSWVSVLFFFGVPACSTSGPYFYMQMALSTTATLGTEESGRCREVETRVIDYE